MMYGDWNVSINARSGVMVVADKSVAVSQKPAIFSSTNDETAMAIASLPYLGYSNTLDYSASTPDPIHSCTKSADFKSAWWSFVAPSDGTAEISGEGRRYDVFGNSGVVLAVYDTVRDAANELACGSYPRNTSTWTPVTKQIKVSKGKTYIIEIAATGGNLNDGGQTIVAVSMK